MSKDIPRPIIGAGSSVAPPLLSGFLNTNQWNPRSLGLWFVTNWQAQQNADVQAFVKASGVNLALFQPSVGYQVNTSGGVGQIQGPIELQQLQNIDQTIAPYIVTHPSQTIQLEKELGLGFQSPNDPNYFVPYYSPDKDTAVVASAIDQAEPFQAIVSGLEGYGYPDSLIADTIIQVCSNYFQSVRGDGNYWHVAAALGFPYDFQILEPIYGINPYTPAQQQAIASQDSGFTVSPTGTFSLGTSAWVNHLGGEVVNLCFPFSDTNTQSVASLIHTAFLTYFDQQNAAILYGIHSNFDRIIATALPDVSERMYQYCQQVGNGYNFGNMLSPVPFTPGQMQFLSQSQFYNPIQIHPPTFGDSFALTILAGTTPWIVKGGATVSYENQTSYYGLDPSTFMPLVLKNYARRLHLWMAASKLPLIPAVSLLKPFADLYDT